MKDTFTYLVLLLFLLTGFFLLCGGINKYEDTYCKFIETSHEEKCKGKYTMNSIPELSKMATTLDIKNGNFTGLTENTFLNITNSNITILRMIKCNITSISNNAFIHLTNVEELDLSRNYNGLNVSNISQSLHSLAHSNIRKIVLNGMGWTSLPRNMFYGLERTNISEIRLNHNFFRQIDGNVFERLQSLRFLDLSWNGLTGKGINFTGLSHITNLSLSGNWFAYFPNFCDKNNKSYTPNLIDLQIDKSKIISLFKEITCLDNLENLNLNGITLRRLPANTFSQLKSLKRLSLHKLSPQLQVIDGTAFNSSSLNELRFSVTGGFKFTKQNSNHFHITDIFKHCTNLTVLDLSYNRIKLSDKKLEKMFQPLRQLTTLILKELKMQNIPENLGRVFEHLENLDLSSNKIHYWSDNKPFLDFNNLKTLNLSGNRIGIINESSFPSSWMNGDGPIKQLLLDDNPFSCTCDLIWFRKWMETPEANNISMDRAQWTCSSSKLKVVDYHPSKSAECLVTYIVTSLLAFFLILSTGFIVYICRWRIRLTLYKFRARRKKYTQLRYDEYQYDCFVAYSYGDLHWIQDKLIPIMEERFNRRLCIRDRDFQIGAVFSNHIIESIESSRTVLFLISENFAKDKWCDFQLNVTSDMNIVEGRPTMIPVLLQNISFKHMTEPIYKTINVENCLKWTEGESSEELFWRNILDVIPMSEEYDSLNDRSLQYSVDTYDSGFQAC